MVEKTSSLHEFLDVHYGPKGAQELEQRLEAGMNPEQHWGYREETALHVAARRRRLDAVKMLVAWGVDLDSKNRGQKTAFAHAVRRGFGEIAEFLESKGCQTELTRADQLATLIVGGDLLAATKMLKTDPSLAKTGNPEEDRLLADIAGRPVPNLVELLLNAGADLEATAMDDGTALHQAAWFGQPTIVALLLEAGAPLERFDRYHFSSPLGWAVHGARFSGGAPQRIDHYVQIVTLLLNAGAALHYPGGENDETYQKRLMADAPPEIKHVLIQAINEDASN